LVGRIGFWNPEGWPGFELGWMLRRSFWGRGYATGASVINCWWAHVNLLDCTMLPPNFGVTNSGWFQTGK
jgi:hypothetical protein